LAVPAIRHCESQGLIKPNRTASGQRRFARLDIRRLSFIKIAQSPGFNLPYIRDLLAELPDHRTPSGTDWARISKNFESVLDARIKRLKQLRDTLSSCIGCGCLSLKSTLCTIIAITLDSTAPVRCLFLKHQKVMGHEKDPRQASGQVQQGDTCHNPDIQRVSNLTDNNLCVK
jgi:MerR family transcriptional regulator, redox-sensitive transcriptional activator SoxR